MHVCKYWFELLNLSRFSDDSIWHFHRCHISYQTAPFKIFLKGDPRKLHTVVLGKQVTSASKAQLMQFLCLIGASTKKLKISKQWKRMLSLNEILSNFPKLETLETKVLMLNQYFLLPASCLKNLHLGLIPHFIPKKQIDILIYLINSTYIIITIDGIKMAPLDNYNEFINIELPVLEFANLINAYAIKVKNINIRDVENINVSDSIDMDNAYGALKQEPVIFYKDYLKKLTGLKSLDFIFRQQLPNGCWFGHEILDHPTIDYMFVDYSDQNQCKQCIEYFFKSFSQLKKIMIHGLKFEFGDLLATHWNFNKLSIGFGKTSQNFLTIPTKLFSKLQHLTSLHLGPLHNELGFDVIAKLPKMMKLEFLELVFVAKWEFEKFSLFSRLCPNVRKLDVVTADTYTLAQIAVIFQRMPYLHTVSMGSFEFSHFNVETFADVIAPFAKNLKDFNLYGRDGDYENYELIRYGKQEMLYLLNKIPTLRYNFD